MVKKKGSVFFLFLWEIYFKDSSLLGCDAASLVSGSRRFENVHLQVFKVIALNYDTRRQESSINLLKPNDPYSGRTAPLTSKSCISYIYSTNIGTEYFKHGIYSPFFLFKMQLFHNSNVFGSCIIHILYTTCAKIKKK